MREIIVTIMLAAIIVITFAITLLAFIWCTNDVEQQEVAVGTTSEVGQVNEDDRG